MTAFRYACVYGQHDIITLLKDYFVRCGAEDKALVIDASLKANPELLDVQHSKVRYSNTVFFMWFVWSQILHYVLISYALG